MGIHTFAHNFVTLPCILGCGCQYEHGIIQRCKKWVSIMLPASFLLDNPWIKMHYWITETILNVMVHFDPPMADTVIHER